VRGARPVGHRLSALEHNSVKVPGKLPALFFLDSEAFFPAIIESESESEPKHLRASRRSMCSLRSLRSMRWDLYFP
jgi:hypothetical protein